MSYSGLDLQDSSAQAELGNPLLGGAGSESPVITQPLTAFGLRFSPLRRLPGPLAHGQAAVAGMVSPVGRG
jgi:hypothetical protein